MLSKCNSNYLRSNNKYPFEKKIIFNGYLIKVEQKLNPIEFFDFLEISKLNIFPEVLEIAECAVLPRS